MDEEKIMSEEEYDGPADEFGMPLLAEDDETQAPSGTAMAADFTLPKLPRLEWRGRGDAECWVEFMDPEELSRADLRAIRTSAGGAGSNKGDLQNRLLNAGLVKLITSWDIGYRPNLPIPSAGKNPTAILDMLSWVDGRRLEMHIEPTLSALVRGTNQTGAGSGKGSPPTPERD